MGAGENVFALKETSVPILRYLLENRAAVERDTYESLFTLVDTIQSTCATFDLFIQYLRKESGFHKDIHSKLLGLNESPVFGSDTLMAFIGILQSYHLSAKSELDSLSERLRTTLVSSPIENRGASQSEEITHVSASTPISTATSTALPKSNPKPSSTEPLSIKPIKPPSEVAPASSNRGWFKSRNRKKKLAKTPVTQTPEKVSEEMESSSSLQTISNQQQLVDDEGFSIRPNINKDDLDSFYSSSDDDGAATADQDISENFQPIKFEIKPLGDEKNSSKVSLDEKASTEELRDKAFNLVIPSKPQKRNRNASAALNCRNTVDVGEMLGLKPSISQRSLHSLQSDCSGFSDNEVIPPPTKPPPRTSSELSKSSAAANFTTSTESAKSTEHFENVETKRSVECESEQPENDHVTPTNKTAPALPPRRSIQNGSPLKAPPLTAPNEKPIPPPRPINNSADGGPRATVVPAGTPPKLPPRRSSLRQSGIFDNPPAPTEKVCENNHDPFSGAPKTSLSRTISGSSLSSSPTSVTASAINSMSVPSRMAGAAMDISNMNPAQLPLAFSIHEKISVMMKSDNITSSAVQISGSLNLMFPLVFLDKMVNGKLGKIAFEVPQLSMFHEAIEVKCLQPLVQIKEKEAVDDPVVYEIDPKQLVEYISSRASMELYHIKLIQYHITVDDKSDCVEESMHLAPLQIMSYCKQLNDSINVKIEYMYNEGAFSKETQPILHETAILARVVGPQQVDGVITEPNATWDSPNKQAVWHLGMLSPNTQPGNGTGVLKAKFTHGELSSVSSSSEDLTAGSDGHHRKNSNDCYEDANSGGSDHSKSNLFNSKPVAVGARFRCEGSVSGVFINLVSTEDYKIARVIHNTTTGQYISISV